MADNGQLSPTILRSVDGINWQPAAQPPILAAPHTLVGDWLIRPTERGFILLSGPTYEQLFEMWTSPDGDVWEPVEGADELIFRNQGTDLQNSSQSRSSTPNLLTMTRYFEDRSAGTYPATTWIIEPS